MIVAARAGLVAALLVLTSLTGNAVYAGDMPVVLITGSNRGIGLEFTRQYAAAGWRVIATARNPGKAAELRQIAAQHPGVVLEELDITSADEVAALAAKYRDEPIDILLNNAALLTDLDDQLLGKLDYALFERTYAVNAIGPMRVTEALLDNVARGKQKLIVTLSSAAGSNGLLFPPANLYQYRSSKAALNLLMHNLAMDLKSRGIRVALLNPGLVDTRGILALGPDDPVPEEFAALMPLIRSGKITLITPTESVTGMRQVIDSLTPEQSGVFLNYDGQVLPW